MLDTPPHDTFLEFLKFL